MSPSSDPPEGVLTWSQDGQPRSRLYGDVYFSTEDGLAEARAVFLDGCGLPQAWAGRDRFVVGELGFGSGLNILALLDLWRTHRPPGATLHVFSIEAHPLSAPEAARALEAWPQIADLAALLTSRWPGRARGFHRVDLPELGAVLDVAIMEVGEALREWSGAADAWFLDGFSPALNPAMWRPEILNDVAARSAPGARAATFTVAGQVRRDLAAAGFAVAKQPGFGRKRERLEAVLGEAAPRPTSPPRVAIIGAGIAGAALARALRALGAAPLLIEAEAAGAGASGNPAAVATPRLDAGLEAPARLFAQAFARAVRLFEDVPEAVISRGAMQLAKDARDVERFGKIVDADIFEPGELRLLQPADVEARLGRGGVAIAFDRGLVLSPAPVLAAWGGEITRARATALSHDAQGWRILDAGGGLVAAADVVILAAGADCGELWDALPLSPVRGQASWAMLGDLDIPAMAWGGYAAPLPGGVLFGATQDRDDAGSDLRAHDHLRNLETLAQALPDLAARLADTKLEGRASVRAVTPDRLPLAGPVPDAPQGLFVLAGLGSRGFTLAPLLAEHVAALALGAPSPLPATLAATTAPDRFARRAARKGRPRKGRIDPVQRED